MPDPYLLPNGTLRNKVGADNQDELSRLEADVVAVREAELLTSGIAPPFDIDKLRWVHRRLFRDVYDWAGMFRAVNLSKGVEDGSGAFSKFVEVGLLPYEGATLGITLRRLANAPVSTDREFAASAADAFVQVNNLHPFREGNGRTQRVLLWALSKSVGVGLSFDVISRERMVSASISGLDGDPEPMQRLFREIVDPVRVAALRKAIAHLKRSGVKWNDLYVSTTTDGQPYHGKLAGRAGDDFMLRVDHPEPGIVIGHVDDIEDASSTGEDVIFTASKF